MSVVCVFCFVGIVSLANTATNEVHAASGDTSIDQGTIITVSASFCDGDLLCDPEENYISCPTDCEAPPMPTTTPTSTPREDGRRPTGYKTRVEQGNIVRLDEIESDLPEGSLGGFGPVVEFVEDFVSGGVSSIPDIRITDPAIGLFSDTLRVSINPATDNVSFGWLASGRMVRILRDDGTFPTSPLDGGVVVYEGDGASFNDTDINPQNTYYYSLFVQGKDGEYTYRERVVVQTVERTAIVVATSTVDTKNIQYTQQIFRLLGILLLLIIAWKLFTRSLVR
jgi:hypothetical protein